MIFTENHLKTINSDCVFKAFSALGGFPGFLVKFNKISGISLNLAIFQEYHTFSRNNGKVDFSGPYTC